MQPHWLLVFHIIGPFNVGKGLDFRFSSSVGSDFSDGCFILHIALSCYASRVVVWTPYFFVRCLYWHNYVTNRCDTCSTRVYVYLANVYPYQPTLYWLLPFWRRSPTNLLTAYSPFPFSCLMCHDWRFSVLALPSGWAEDKGVLEGGVFHLFLPGSPF